MTKPALLLLALYGLGDDDFRVRQASERYLAASGYAAVPLNRLAPRLTRSVQARVTLRKLERRYYRFYANLHDDWRAYPSLTLLSPWCRPDVYHRTFWFPTCLGPGDPFRPLVDHYAGRAFHPREPTYLSRGSAGGGGATLEFLKDLRSWGAPAWSGRLLLSYLNWRHASLERRYDFKDFYYPPWRRGLYHLRITS